MGEKDLISKKIEDYNEVFADVYNTLLFRKRFLIPERLWSGSTESVYRGETGELHSQRRDVLKQYLDEAHLVISFLGIENQSTVDPVMPVRIMSYDAGSYRQQLCGEENVLRPVITIVLNMTEKKWNAAKSIHEMLEMDTELAEYVQDYKIYVFDVAFLEEETIEAFQSDFGEIARFFKRKRLGEDPLASEVPLRHPREILEFISAFTQDQRYRESISYLEEAKREGEVVTMCAVAEALVNEGIEQGMERGSSRKLVGQVCRKMRKGKPVIMIADELEEDYQTVARICGIAGEFEPDYDDEAVWQKYLVEEGL